MKKILAGVALALLSLCHLAFAPALASDARFDELLTMRVEGEIVVDAAGNVVSHAIATPLKPQVKQFIDDAVRQWAFKPPRVGGKATAGRASMHITVASRASNGGYDVSIDNVVFRAPGEGKARRPMHLTLVDRTPAARYPDKFRVNGTVMLLLQVTPDGAVANVSPTQCSLFFADADPGLKAAACEAMEDSALRAVRQWKFEVRDTARQPSDFIGYMPFQFFVRGDGTKQVAATTVPGQWRAESRTPYAKPAWESAAQVQRIGTADVIGTTLLPADAPLEFREGGPA